jgi:hypothetical protein
MLLAIFLPALLIAIVRGIMLKGSTLGDLWPQVIALGILGIILYALATNRLWEGLA